MSINAKQSVSGTVGVGTVNVYSYYTPNVTQPDDNTMQVEYIPSEHNMPSIEPVTLTLPNGKDGYTPQKGVDYFDGKDGRDGVDGKDGYIPQKGVDYFTEDDVSQIADVAADTVQVTIDELLAQGGIGYISGTGEVVAELVLDRTDLAWMTYCIEPIDKPILVEGDYYSVITDSGEYIAVCKRPPIDEHMDELYIGNGKLYYGVDSGESFLYRERPLQDGCYAHAIDLNGGTKMMIATTTAHRIDPKFLPEPKIDTESFATKDYVDQLITGAIGGSY